jgi:hypothetical protein
MRLFSFAVVFSCALAQPCGFAQGQSSPATYFKGLTKEDLRTVCLYNDTVYTNGSLICVGNGVALFCGVEKSPMWSAVEKGNPSASACAK